MKGEMMSRAGKYTEEKYTVIKKQDEILSGYQRKFVVKSSMLAPPKELLDEIIYSTTKSNY